MACKAVTILHNPLDFMYAKINRFLNKSPSWTVSRLPSYWIDKILLMPPEIDNAHYREVGWLLDTLIEGLRTQEVSNRP